MAERFEASPQDAREVDWYALVTQPTPGSATLGKAVKLFGASAIVLIALNLYAPGSPTILERVLASAILASAALPVWLWMRCTDRTIPFMPFLTLIFAYYFALPVFLLKRYVTGLFNPGISEHFITLALAYSLLGLYCMFAGYYGPAKWLFAPILPRFNLRWRDTRVVKIVALMLGVAGLFVASSSAGVLTEGLSQIGTFAADLSMVGICTLVALQLVGRSDWITSAFVWGFLVPVRIAIGLGTGLASNGLIIGLAVAMMFASVRRSIPWKTLLLGTMGLFILHPAERMFRTATWGGRLSEAGAVERVRAFGDFVYRTAMAGTVAPQVLIEFAGMRLAQFTVFGEVIADTPAMVPFWEGESYYPILFKPIPRFIMPDKPEEVSGGWFGHRYGLITIENVSTSINLPQIVELYGNFALVGVIVGMFIFGLIYRVLIDMYVHPGMGLGALVGVVYVSSKLIDVGSAASLVFGEVPWSIIFIAMIHLLMEAAELDAMTL